MVTFDPWGKEPLPETATRDDDDVLNALEAAAERSRDIARRVYELTMQDEARRKFSRQQRAERPPPRVVNLADFLTEPDNDPAYRIEDLWPTGGRIVLAAQQKAGKTTAIGNLLRALADGAPFLERFTVQPAHRIVLIDDELDERTLRRWLRTQDIDNPGAVDLVPLRGNVASFDILDNDIRAEWAKRLHGADVVILDCLRPVLDALNLDENHDAGRFLVALDELLGEAACSEAAVSHHMGHGAERSRGDSRILDWPDATWKLVRMKDDEQPEMDDLSGPRFFSAYGRDVDFPQSEMTYDPESKRLTLGETAPNRKQATAKRNARKADEAVMKAVSDKPGITKRGLRETASAFGATHAEDVDRAVERLVEQGLIWRQRQGAAQLHWPSRGIQNPDETDSVSSVSKGVQEGLDTLRSEVGAGVPFRAPTAGHIQPPGQCDQPDQLDLATDTPEPTKPCPDCGTDTPEHQTRCRDCTLTFIEQRRTQQ